MRMRTLAAVAAVVALAACAAPSPGGGGASVEDRWLAAAGGAVDYQLGGASDPAPGTTIVARDASDPPAEGVFSICYLNGFQTQPGDAAWWLDEHPDLLLRDDAGEPMIDPAWPDEMALDASTPERRAAIAAIVRPWIAGCADAGYDAVELDNLDSWTRFEGLTMAGNLALAETLVDVIHDTGMWAAQKNALEAGEEGPAAGFDLVITEQCGRYGECAGYAALFGDRHLDVEYVDATTASAFLAACAAGDVPPLSVLRDVDLVPEGASGHVRVPCP